MIEFIDLNQLSYGDALNKMRLFTQEQIKQKKTLQNQITSSATKHSLVRGGVKNQVWFCEHFPVFTLGRHGDKKHLLNPKGIEVFQSDRGGEVTYHGPGQLVIYTLFDLNSLTLSVKGLVKVLENITISILDKVSNHHIKAHLYSKNPGVYTTTNGQIYKIASLGLRIQQGRSFHGIALNYAMDLSPFSQINPCGLVEVKVSQICDQLPISNYIKAPNLRTKLITLYKNEFNHIFNKANCEI